MRPIDADALVDEIKRVQRTCEEIYDSDGAAIADLIRHKVECVMPTIDAVPVRHAHFKYVTFFNGCTMDENLVCSECEQSVSGNENYCPNCGKRIEWESAE